MCKFVCYIVCLAGFGCVRIVGFWMCCVFDDCFVGVVNCVVRFGCFILVWLFAIADWWFVCLCVGDFGLWFMCLQVCLAVCFGFLLLSFCYASLVLGVARLVWWFNFGLRGWVLLDCCV